MFVTQQLSLHLYDIHVSTLVFQHTEMHKHTAKQSTLYTDAVWLFMHVY